MTTNSPESQKTPDIVQELQKENLDGLALKKLLDTRQEKTLLVDQLTKNNEQFLNAIKPNQEKICTVCKDIAKETQQLISGSPEFAVMYLYTALVGTDKNPSKEQVLANFKTLQQPSTPSSSPTPETKPQAEEEAPRHEIWQIYPDLYQENNPQFGTLTDEAGQVIATGRIDFYDKNGNIITPNAISSGEAIPVSLGISGGKDSSGFLSQSDGSFTQQDKTISFFNGQEKRVFTFQNNTFPRISSVSNENISSSPQNGTSQYDPDKNTSTIASEKGKQIPQPSSNETKNAVNPTTTDDTPNTKAALDNQKIDAKEAGDKAHETVDKTDEIIKEVKDNLDKFWEIKNFMDENLELSQTIEKITSNIFEYESAGEGQETKKEGYKTESIGLIKQLNSLDVSKISNPQISGLITTIKNYTFDPNRAFSSNITSLSDMANKSLKTIHDYNNSYRKKNNVLLRNEKGELENLGENDSSFIQVDGGTLKPSLVDLQYGTFKGKMFEELRAIKNPEFEIIVSKIKDLPEGHPQVITRIFVKEKK